MAADSREGASQISRSPEAVGPMWVCVILAVFPSSSVALAQSQPDSRILRLIENVEANEQLYGSIEVVSHVTYRLDETTSLKTSKHLTSRETTVRSVKQGRLFYLKEAGKETQVSGATLERSTIQGYDGEMTRVVVDNRVVTDPATKTVPIANLQHGRTETTQLFAPHTWLLSRSGARFLPLSIWLRGGKDLEKHPGGFRYHDRIQKASIEKEEVVEGLPTIKLRCETWNRGERPRLNTLRYLWLAPERNYLPVKTEAYFPQISLQLPGEVGHVKDFREIVPGVWLPFERVVTVYDSDKIREEKKLVFHNEDEGRIQKVKLDPQYDISLFRDIPIPDGARVHEIKEGKVVRSYKQGEDKEDEELRQGSSGTRWLITIVAVIALLTGCGFAYLRLQGTRKEHG